LIGEVRNIRVPYYDKVKKAMGFKVRPAIIIANADADDYVVIPVSKVSDPSKIDPVYDVPVDPAQYPMLGLTVKSYIRTHKQTVVHTTLISKCLGDIKVNYEELFLEVLEKREDFSKSITEQAIR